VLGFSKEAQGVASSRCGLHTCAVRQIEGSAVRGAGRDEVGTFTLEGTLEGSAFRATKTYVTHTVDYTGTLATRGASAVIAGAWDVGGMSDRFELEIAPAPPLAGGRVTAGVVSLCLGG
jgi:hypothetical protein